jgi:hypothetical protein
MSLRILRKVVAGLVFLALPLPSWAGQAQPAASPFKGEYFCTRNQDPICVPFTRNLNQFRRIDFDVCNPRLSQKYSQFARPAWEEVPFDLGVAEKILRNPPQDSGAERWWQIWLKASESLRTEGKIKLWRIRLDIDGDGVPETIVRLDYLLASNTGREEQGWQLEQNPCPYRGRVYMLDSPNDAMRKAFNHTSYRITDIIHYSDARVYPGQSAGYYGVDQRFTLPTEPDGPRIGATRGMKVYLLNKWGSGEVCSIDWVPTGHYRPLKRSRTPR